MGLTNPTDQYEYIYYPGWGHVSVNCKQNYLGWSRPTDSAYGTLWELIQSGIQNYPVIESPKGSRFLRPMGCTAHKCNCGSLVRSLNSNWGTAFTVRGKHRDVYSCSWQGLSNPSSQGWRLYRPMWLDGWNKESNVVSVNAQLDGPSQVVLKVQNWTEQSVFRELSNIYPTPKITLAWMLK